MAESTKPAKAALPKSVFEVDIPNHELLKLAYDAFLANSRQASATTRNCPRLASTSLCAKL